MRVTCRALVASGILAGLLVVPAGSAAAEDLECSTIDPSQAPVTATGESRPLSLLGVRRAHDLMERRGQLPGEGTRVAVLDSGVYGDRVDVVDSMSVTGRTEPVDLHGTAVAGLVAGAPREDGKLVGIAPYAEIVDVRVYDARDPDTDDGEVGVSTEGLVEGLRHIADNQATLQVDVVNISLAVPDDAELERLVRVLSETHDIVVVAASGNRPAEGDPLYAEFGYDGGPRPLGEDAADGVFPAAYDEVVAVNATAEGSDEMPGDTVLQSSATDVAAPTFGAISATTNGSTCVLREVATSWAAAEVSGVVAMLRSAYPQESASQIVARLTTTANGTTAVPTVLTGAGVVQPVEALARPLRPEPDGTLDRTAVAEGGDLRATEPEPEADTLARTRGLAVWWGLLGGGALVCALLLRPLLARRGD